MINDLSKDEIIKQLEERIKELEANLDRNSQSSFNVVKYILKKRNKPKVIYIINIIISLW